ncbi:MAG: hypothetical protein FJ288_00670 [Planctomycetes bacterium]|nr:hypothetical protein [Planctomycetota bacterium]
MDALLDFFASILAPSNPLWLYYPLCAAAAVVYKATKFDEPRDIARAALLFFLHVTGGMFALAVLTYLVSLAF